MSSSSFSSRKKYDVFLSFRGEDTRKNFTDHLYAALKRSGIKTFRDDSKLEAGEEIAPELFKAIQESWCSVIVFSKTYAFSGWCLDELVEIVKQRNQRGHKIFPIFYDVDPSDLRKQIGKVGEAFVKHGNNDKIQRWRTALTEVANLKGWHLNNSEMVEMQLIINFGGQWEGSIYEGGDSEIILVDTNLRYKDLLSTVHGMVETDRNSFVYEIKSLLNAGGKTVKLTIKNDRDVQFAIEKANDLLQVYVTVKPSQQSSEQPSQPLHEPIHQMLGQQDSFIQLLTTQFDLAHASSSYL